jgi:2-methylaconitate cis-trans-isomerase PrpF
MKSGIKDTVIDVSGNCGNLSSMIGVFAVDDGICHVRPSEPNMETPTRITIRSFNTNTSKAVDTTFPVSSTSSSASSMAILDLPEVEMAGVPGRASRIDMEFLHPAGARTGQLLPAGSPTSEVYTDKSILRISCVDATNPTVFLTAREFRVQAGLHEEDPIDFARHDTLELLEKIRRSGAALMNLDPSTQAQPKVAVLSSPSQEDINKGVEIVIHALSMGVLHKAVPGTVGLCLGVAAQVPGTVAWEIVQESRARRQGGGPEEGFVRMKHPSGITDVGAAFDSDGTLKSVKVIRTGRRLMKGSVWW